MNDVLKQLQRFQPVLLFVKKYIRVIFFVLLISLCSFLVFQINHYASVEPTDDAVSAKLESVSRPHIDQGAIDKINQLKDQNVEVESLFKQTRDNPFSE